ncbi:hypothetical protein CIB84_016576 [Bambusicola thoracicus]|uniref:Uncharacterized protein n=1 Tax=Bambusicola thoracicus TaxID=9083 RepID=A0A2P4S6E3_BAMTH|nr:hypothetical protein CIB84_016576 [Bambusicola thoracicus]
MVRQKYPATTGGDSEK